MKLIIGVYDREVSHNLAVILSSKKIIPIEAEAIEEIPALLKMHPQAMLLCEETSIEFYQNLQQNNLLTDTFLLYHPNLSTYDLLQLRQFGLKSLIPYTENAYLIIEEIIKQLSLLSGSLKKNDPSLMMPNSKSASQAALYLLPLKKWTYAHLLGLNSSKVSILIEKEDIKEILLKESYKEESLLLYLQGLNIRIFVDLVYSENNNFIFRYRKMAKSDAQRLAYFINYCQNNSATETVTVNI